MGGQSRVQIAVGARELSSPRHADWLWGPLSFLFSEYKVVRQG